MVLGNSHLFMNRSNKLAVIASHIQESRFLYPGKNGRLGDFFGDRGNPSSEFTPSGSKDGKYELLTAANEVIVEEIKDLMTKRHIAASLASANWMPSHPPAAVTPPGCENQMSPVGHTCPGGEPALWIVVISFLTDSGDIEGQHTETLLAGSLAKALCYIHRMNKDVKDNQEMKSRILVIKAAEDSTLQYMNFMNVIFAAQKQNILIDACVLDSDSGLLQQACDITGGLYLKVPQMPSLLQYLLWVFLPDQDQRSQLTLPPPVHVDYRAACFCHRNLIEIGYVCSVCLSIFCNFSPICTTCETAFKISLPPVLKAKKKKLKMSA
ncbi:hypothetical protein J1605_012723 [Eschrichtius robustus]|uniref:General transcription factor IIH subunit 3 n=2 Tax=Eschrichtius robustus TaxID=9764 RepID=A0AB34GGL0_ESCRO|nr:hypothetical protein J1605_012723 [Eschrichtius robustus]